MTGVAVRQRPFVTAAQLAGRLYGVLATARLMALSASNAKGIAARGGERTAGFRPITDFISEMASDTIALVSRINDVALQVSRTSVSAMRAGAARGRLATAVAMLSGHERGTQLQAVITGLDRQLDGCRQQEQQAMHKLIELFDDIEQRTRAAKMIVTNSRTEASRAGEFQTYLESIADSVEQAADSIRGEIKACRSYVSDLMEAISAV